MGLAGGHDESRSNGGKKIEHKKKHIEAKQEPNAAKARSTRDCSPGMTNHAPALDGKLTKEIFDEHDGSELMTYGNAQRRYKQHRAAGSTHAAGGAGAGAAGAEPRRGAAESRRVRRRDGRRGRPGPRAVATSTPGVADPCVVSLSPETRDLDLAPCSLALDSKMALYI